MNVDWISISPQNGAAGQNPVAFQLVAENETFEDKQLTVRAVCGDKYKDLTLVLKGKTYPIGTVWNFDYTGDVQQITLPKGKYKLQCWGAQGGSVTGTYAIDGSKGGYSEGVLTLTKTTTLYIFVGGQGTSYTSSASQTSTTTINGGWNGGGAGVRTSRYNSGDTDGRSYPRGGGGATDIATVTSSMSYSSGRTNRSAASLLARCIVAGGGAGASARYTEVTTESTEWVQKINTTSASNKTRDYTETISSIQKTDGQYYSLSTKTYKQNQYYFTSEVDVPSNSSALEMRFEKSTTGGIGVEFRGASGNVTGTFSNTTQPSGTKIKVNIPSGTTSMLFSYLNAAGVTVQNSVAFDGITFYRVIYYKAYTANVQQYAGKDVRLECVGGSNTSLVRYYVLTSSGSTLLTEIESSSSATWDITLPSNAYYIEAHAQNRNTLNYPSSLRFSLYTQENITSTSTSSGKSSKAQQGGGTSGKGQYPGTQSSAGNGGAFGLGASQSSTNYRYCAGGGGGGWYGGGTNKSDSSTSYVNYSGGGSGFVNTSANAASRPSGYTGLQLDSGTTKDGSTSFESTSGGTETGHSGNGYARITVLE